MEKSKVIEMAFEIISYSGDAIDQFYEAINCYKKNNIEEAREHFQCGSDHLNKAHKVQTVLIQSEVNEEEIPYSLIMTHAQDHLTSAINWQRIVRLQEE
ncbi:PTS lactose/cellobiose transporter subunit IIA [Anaerorhabdus sp.]|jgi:lactose PTS system EIIA component|uniref:PTS lactose/cellobiose transporter subunit IIA n=1 Tax=Anaerorhabdus sp. TaxID=1872524 RepID=UPI002FCBD6EC